MPKKSGKTFRLAFVRRRIHTMFKSRALRSALLAELNGGQDAALVVQMVERVTPIVKPPIQAVRRRRKLQQHQWFHPLQWKPHPKSDQWFNPHRQRLLRQQPLMVTQLQQQCRYQTLTVTVTVIKKLLVNYVFILSKLVVSVAYLLLFVVRIFISNYFFLIKLSHFLISYHIIRIIN